jgi:hypothetical protein
VEETYDAAQPRRRCSDALVGRRQREADVLREVLP